jgi:hypothetical protein
MKNEQKVAWKKVVIAGWWTSIIVYAMVSVALLFTVILAPAAVLTAGMAAYSYKQIEKEKAAIAALESEGVSE